MGSNMVATCGSPVHERQSVVTGRPGPVLAVGLGLALLGYLVAALLPLSSVLESWAWVSPWDWALGGDPLFNPTGAARYVALVVATGVLLLAGGVAFARRDVRSA
jgi:ABC-2 type transport system permease protein